MGIKGGRTIRKIIGIVLTIATIAIGTLVGTGCAGKASKSGSKESASVTESVRDLGEAKLSPEDSGITICIDPGHYTNCNVLYFKDGTSYCEGDVTLLIAEKLQQILEEKYGIHSYLTRDNGSITIDGLTDQSLDGAYIHLRGEQAAGADLFVSLHTNANQDYANGYPTCEQPIAINKPILLANRVATGNETALQVGNEIGKNIASLYQEINLSSGYPFEEKKAFQKMDETVYMYIDSENILDISVQQVDSSEFPKIKLYLSVKDDETGEVPDNLDSTLFYVKKRMPMQSM